jgi:hypothetical protein
MLDQQNKHKQASMFRVGFEPTIPAFKLTKTAHALDGASSVIGCLYMRPHYFIQERYNESEVPKQHTVVP